MSRSPGGGSAGASGRSSGAGISRVPSRRRRGRCRTPATRSLVPATRVRRRRSPRADGALHHARDPGPGAEVHGVALQCRWPPAADDHVVTADVAAGLARRTSRAARASPSTAGAPRAPGRRAGPPQRGAEGARGLESRGAGSRRSPDGVAPGTTRAPVEAPPGAAGRRARATSCQPRSGPGAVAPCPAGPGQTCAAGPGDDEPLAGQLRERALDRHG